MRHLKPNLGRKMPLGLVLAAALGVSASHAGSNTDGTKAQQRAQTVKPNAIIIYTLPNCAYCTQAKRWLSANHFAFTECDISARQSCAREFSALHGEGVPLLVIQRGGKQYIMDNGFDAAEFLSFVAAVP